MRLKLDVLTEFSATWYPSAVDTETLFDRAHREIVSEMPVRWDVTDVPLAPGNDTYALPDSVFRVDEAYYVPCADPSTWRRLEPFDFRYEPTVGYDWPYASSPGLPTRGWRVVPNAASNGGGLSLQIAPTPPDPIVLPACPICGDSPCSCDAGGLPQPNGSSPHGEAEDDEPLDEIEGDTGEEEEDSDFSPMTAGGGEGSTVPYAGPGIDPNPDPVPESDDSDEESHVTYPFIRLIGASWVPLGMADELPRGILSEDLYLTHMAHAWAKIQDSERAMYWREMHRAAKADNMRHLKGRMAQTAANRLIPLTARRQTRRV